jgi:hypothetical protein
MPTREQALQELTGWLLTSVHGLSADLARAVLERSAGQRPGALLRYVLAHPAALTDPKPDLPAAAVRLAHELNLAGFLGVVLPRCTSCGQPRRSLATAAPRPAGRVCHPCRQRDRQQRCAICGRVRPVHAVNSGGPVCDSCHRRPARRCGVCGQDRPLARRGDENGPPMCRACYRGPVRRCDGCGRERPCPLRRADGRAYCSACYPVQPRTCGRCGRVRPPVVVWPIGPVCSGCYTQVLDHPHRCGRCGLRMPLVAVEGGQRLCGPCVGFDLRRARSTCGTAGRLEGGRCAGCHLRELVDQMLTAAPARPVREQLRPLADALAATHRPRAVLRWLRGPGGRLLGQLAAGPEPLTHDLLDRLPATNTVHPLRDHLVAAGVLDERAEYLERVPAWVETLL